ncbi:MAG: glycosyltransferase [Eubacteriales bacterium]|nr:glycosyltransferase [Eubacteriales bacterium]
MNILYCGDKPMQKGILLSSMSIIENVDEPLNIYILTVDYSERGINYKPVDKAFVKYLEAKLNKSDIRVNASLIDITRNFVEELPEANMQTRFTACCMLRLFADKTDVNERLLYLDTDVLCRKNFRDFYYQDMEGIEIAGVSDYYGRWLFGDGYINSGVMLMNMKLIRENGLLEKCREQCIRKEMFMPDQTAINTFATRVNLCGHRFNDQRRLHGNTVFQHFTTTFRVFPVIKTVSVKPWEIDKMHNVLGLHEYDELLDSYSREYEKYSAASRVPVFFSINEQYAPYLAVSLKSLAEHVAKDERYRIIVMCDNVKNITMIQLRNVIKYYENIDIEFVDIKKKMHEFSESFGQTVTDRRENRLYSGEFTLTIYFRLFIAELFPELDKAIYIDSDTVVNEDIAKLYSVDMGEAMFGAVRDTFAGNNAILSRYIENAVGIGRSEYVNSGVLLMNLDKIRKMHLADRFLKLMAEYHFDSIAPDQDYINAMCAKDIYFLDKEWNVMPNKGGEYMARPKLIHYNLFDKPWHYSEIPYEEYFWQYAAESGFYPMLLKQREQYGEGERKADHENLEKLLLRAENIADGDGVKFSDVVGSGFSEDI